MRESYINLRYVYCVYDYLKLRYKPIQSLFIKSKIKLIIFINIQGGLMRFNLSPRVVGLVGALTIGTMTYAFAADALKPVARQISLWDFLLAGGWAMALLAAVSVFAVALIIYDFMTLKTELLAPADFTENLVHKLEEGDFEGARTLALKKNNLIATIALAGLNRREKGKVVIREVMENTARKEIAKLWQNISYLGDVAAVAPLLGLLGTVIGMIQAFSVISYAGASLKPIMLVGGISKALVTTAAGLVVAIPSLGFYSYFRGIVQTASNEIETYTTDIIKLIEDPAAIKKTKV